MKVICLPGIPNETYKTRLFLNHLRIEPMAPGGSKDGPRLWTTNQPWKDVRRRPTDINGKMAESSKPWLASCVREAFGYGYAINPTTWEGPAVEKWHAHARHPKIVMCPCRPKHQHFYSELLFGAEFRIAVFRDEFICTSTKREIGENGLPSERRIDGSSRYNVPWQEVMAKTERQKMLALCSLLGVDYAEFDAIRNFDGRFCVIDCNPGPSSPSPHSFIKGDYDRIIPTESECFSRLINRSAIL